MTEFTRPGLNLHKEIKMEFKNELESESEIDAQKTHRSGGEGVALTESAPEPMIAGTFALYQTPDGGMILVTDVKDRGVEQKIIPPALVKMVMGGGGPMGKLARKMFGD